MKLEELLKLKSFEKPSSEQWEQFDTQLKRKMLLCIVNEKRVTSQKWFKLAIALTSTCAVLLLLAATFKIENYSNNNPYTAIAQLPINSDTAKNYYSKNELLSKTFDMPITMCIKNNDSLSQNNYLAVTPETLNAIGF